ncbi:MAG: transcription-repair coupling factor [Planctomycetota bacterium]
MNVPPKPSSDASPEGHDPVPADAPLPLPDGAPILRGLAKRLLARPGFSTTLERLRTTKSVAFDGVWGSTAAVLAGAIAEAAAGPLLVVCSQPGEVDELCADIGLLAQCELWRFPAWEAEPGDRVWHDETFCERLRTLRRLDTTAHSAAGAHSHAFVVTSVQALLQPVPAPATLARGARTLRAGQRLQVPELLAWLVEQQFEGVPAVSLPGEFSVRGGIVDIFPLDADLPARLDLFDDEIESIRRFDVVTQRSLDSLTQLELAAFPKALAERESLLAHLPPSSTVLLLDTRVIRDEGERYLSRVERPQDYVTTQELFAGMARFAVATAGGVGEAADESACRLGMESVERFSGDFERVRAELDHVAGGAEVVMVARTDAEARRLADIFGTTDVADRGRLSVAIGSLRNGFRMRVPEPPGGRPLGPRPLVRDEAGSGELVVLTGSELFRREEVRRPTRRHLGKAIDSFIDLQEGDLVVHLGQGIGRYRGMKMIEKHGQMVEHLELEFAEQTRMFVPTTKIELVQKYVGGTKSQPKLAKIGGQVWARQKKAAEESVVDMAGELLELQAARVTRPGIAFGPDSDWQRAFDASFPYQETEDQLAAIEAIKADMERPRPMDRLLCGDVGFGKTEVAMRAVFKAIDNGYQVAVLVPTTILAEQHYHSFKQRMAEFPFDVGRLSRFCTPDEEKRVLQGLKTGHVDVVIGTHRVASADVEFHNLGLVIIDEEQRFGVDVKERLKTLRNTVDVLTLSATPIPRTLHMSLVGVRDISNLETPPQERMAVETRVTRSDPELIRHAVLRELNRSGQVYFVHNRVQDIYELKHRLDSLLPDARIRVGHGQMNEQELEQVMVDFVAHKFDVLLATTIVESGLDIPNANTILIDEADRYGLADLHQLRGRVGRYKHRAYCYLLIDAHKHVTPNAARRLRAIEEFSDMGAGFAISMRDLEIRGAGNLLGSQQSGHIAAVGYELYCNLLEAAVRDLKHLPPKRALDVDIDLPGDAFIGADYIADMRQKIDVYRRLSRITLYDEVDMLRKELADRFGPPPDPVERLLALAELRLDAAIWQVAAVRREEQYLVFAYSDRRRIEQLSRLCKGKLRVVDAKHAYLTVPADWQTPDRLWRLAKSVLRPR